MLDRGMEKSGSSANFPKRAGCTPWFFRMSAGTKLNCVFNNSGPISEKKLNKKMHFSRATFLREEFWGS